MNKKNKFEKGLQDNAKALEDAILADDRALFEAIAEEFETGVDAEKILRKRAVDAAARFYDNVTENMNPQQWA